MAQHQVAMEATMHHSLESTNACSYINFGHGIYLPVMTCQSDSCNGREPASARQQEDNSMSASRETASALTPRPLRLLLVGRVKPGAEPGLRAIQAQFPVAVAEEVGISAFEAYVGSGQYAITIEIDRPNVQHVLATFFNDSRIRDFRTRLEPFVEGLPGPGYQFGSARAATEHQADAGVSTTIYNTGDLHFAASMYRWRQGEPPRTGTSLRGSDGAR
jgi:hypothetical protein